MMSFQAGQLVTHTGVVVGEYWTCEAIAEHNTICIQLGDNLLTVERADLPDWAQCHDVLMNEWLAPLPYAAALDPFDVGIDIAE